MGSGGQGLGADFNPKDSRDAKYGTDAEKGGQKGCWQWQAEESASRQGAEATAAGASTTGTGEEGLAAGGATVCATAGVEVVWQGWHGQQGSAGKMEAAAGAGAGEGIWDLAAAAKGAGRRARGQRVC